MYFQSHFPFPVGFANSIEKIQWDFPWGDVGDEFRFYVVS